MSAGLLECRDLLNGWDVTLNFITKGLLGKMLSQFMYPTKYQTQYRHIYFWWSHCPIPQHCNLSLFFSVEPFQTGWGVSILPLGWESLSPSGRVLCRRTRMKYKKLEEKVKNWDLFSLASAGHIVWNTRKLYRIFKRAKKERHRKGGIIDGPRRWNMD